MMRFLADLTQDFPGDLSYRAPPVRICSIACGPYGEISEFLDLVAGQVSFPGYPGLSVVLIHAPGNIKSFMHAYAF